ncbi:MAG: hypothetical protein JW751_07765 [Polyangiaceae bacterium]|nr:hypothetical protein [Polyangiaceae bacterium]
MSKATPPIRFVDTWPMFEDGPKQPLPVDPFDAMNAVAPPSKELSELSHVTELPDSSEEAEARAREVRASSAPPPAPEWKRAAQSLIAELQRILRADSATLDQQRAISRAWAAWTLAGTNEGQVLRTAHLVVRAHEAIHQTDSARRNPVSAVSPTARVLQAGLPSAVRDRIPAERVEQVVTRLQLTHDTWRAVVEGTAELLGWTDCARSHAAAVVCAAMERRGHR